MHVIVCTCNEKEERVPSISSALKDALIAGLTSERNSINDTPRVYGLRISVLVDSTSMSVVLQVNLISSGVCTQRTKHM